MFTRLRQAAIRLWRNGRAQGLLRRAAANAQRNALSGNSSHGIRRCPSSQPRFPSIAADLLLRDRHERYCRWQFARFGTIRHSSDLPGQNPKAREHQVQPAQIPPAPVWTGGRQAGAEAVTPSAPFVKRGQVRPHGFEPAKLRSTVQRDWLTTNWPTDLPVASAPEQALPRQEEEPATVSRSALR